MTHVQTESGNPQLYAEPIPTAQGATQHPQTPQPLSIRIRKLSPLLPPVLLRVPQNTHRAHTEHIRYRRRRSSYTSRQRSAYHPFSHPPHLRPHLRPHLTTPKDPPLSTPHTHHDCQPAQLLSIPPVTPACNRLQSGTNPATPPRAPARQSVPTGHSKITLPCVNQRRLGYEMKVEGRRVAG